MLGHSGARITIHDGVVHKTGGSMPLGEQARLMAYMGESVCPKIVRRATNEYWMERLTCCPPPLTQEGVLARLWAVYGILRDDVWSREALYNSGGQRLFWGQDLKIWMEKNSVTWIPPEVLNGWMQKGGEWCLTHGDPTLANVMLNDALELRLIDAAPPRPGIPCLREVDLGKLLQSAAGYEAVVSSGEWLQPSPEMPLLFLSEISEELRAPALFWGAIHCSRLMVRATRPDIRQWGEEKSRFFTEELARAVRI